MMMTDLEAIEARRSRRAYTGPLSGQQLQRLQQAVAAQKVHSGLFIRLVEDASAAFGGITKSYGMFSGVRSLFTLACRGDDEAAREAAGYHGQRLVLEATKLGLGTCWVAGTYDRRRMAATMDPGLALLAVITVGPVKEKQSLVERTVRRATHGRDTGWQSLYTAQGDPPQWFLAGVRAAALAPSAMNKKPVRFSWQGGGAAAAIPGGAPSQWLDLGIAKLHFELAAGGRFAPGNNAAFTKEGAGAP